ncbi:unnamed protein product [Callosobruchus maculatus]|uniref:DDE-1 domain-containing protein n=1 Tax=Callosobruchus maculatus TaxID=64391 RepID=A0A653DN03_CALMS|nr:unnamed protein product [Callosobruchus maculatus]
MPRVYKRKIGSRNYRNYTNERLEEALKNIRQNKLSIRLASEKYGIHRNTLWLKLKGKHNKPHGQQKVFTDQEENVFVVHIITMSDFGFPVTSFDLRCIVKCYLQQCGRKINCFKQNLPGNDWVKSFLARHPILTQRFAQNISHARAATDEETINKFFDHLEKELDGIPPGNIWNYDETNLVDDPGLKKVITRRGTKYPEKIRNASKACTSLMLCGNAMGDLVPVYVNYRSQKLWSTWTENGPPNARYNRTKSGWFDYQVFEDWFLHLLLPILKRQDGPKAIIGDNLSSHLNIKVIQECEANNIRFIALPPNTTNLLQPLDVAHFRPMKIQWRKILDTWKESSRGSRYTTIPKEEFPSLLKSLMQTLEEKSSENLKSGFRKCGIFPSNREQVLNRLTFRNVTADNEVIRNVSDSFIEHLTKIRCDSTKTRQIRRKKRLNVPPGKSISAADLLNPQETANDNHVTVIDEPQPSCSYLPPPRPTVARRTNRHSDTSSECESEVPYEESDTSSGDGSVSSDECTAPGGKESLPATTEVHKAVGKYVVVKYEADYFPGRITRLQKTGAYVSVLMQCGKQWKWPPKKDEIFYRNDEIIMNIDEPIQRGTRELYDIPMMQNFI